MSNITFMILLIIAGVIFILAELLLVPGVGVAGVLGLVSMAGACWYAFVFIGTREFVIVTAISLAILIAAVIYALRARTWQKLALNTRIESTVADGVPQVGPGCKGIAQTRLAPMGTVRFGDTSLEVKSASGMVDAGTEVEVAYVEENKIYVKPLK